MEWLWAFGAGFFAGLICIGGLSLGSKLLMDAVPADENAPQVANKKGKIIWAAVILILQFVVAAGTLYASRWVREFPLQAGVGILLSIGLGSLLLKGILTGKK